MLCGSAARGRGHCMKQGAFGFCSFDDCTHCRNVPRIPATRMAASQAHNCAIGCTEYLQNARQATYGGLHKVKVVDQHILADTAHERPNPRSLYVPCIYSTHANQPQNVLTATRWFIGLSTGKSSEQVYESGGWQQGLCTGGQVGRLTKHPRKATG